MEQLCLQIKDLNVKSQLITSKVEAEIAELKSNAVIYKSQVANFFKGPISGTRKVQTNNSKAERAIRTPTRPCVCLVS